MLMRARLRSVLHIRALYKNINKKNDNIARPACNICTVGWDAGLFVLPVVAGLLLCVADQGGVSVNSVDEFAVGQHEKQARHES